MIIHPIFFYLMNAFHAADVVAILVAISTSIVALFMIILWVVAASEENEEGRRAVEKYIKTCAHVLSWSLLATILIPSEETVLMMLAASMATTDNVNAVFDALKAAIDYAVTILQ